ncbi:MAG: ATP-binding protein [Actinomycetota bacterium]
MSPADLPRSSEEFRIRLYQATWMLVVMVVVATTVLALVAIGAVGNLRQAKADVEQRAANDAVLTSVSDRISSAVIDAESPTPTRRSSSGEGRTVLRRWFLERMAELRSGIEASEGDATSILAAADSMERSGLVVIEAMVELDAAAAAGDDAEVNVQRRFLRNHWAAFGLDRNNTQDLLLEAKADRLEQMVNEGDRRLRQLALAAGPTLLLLFGMFWLVRQVRSREAALVASVQRRQQQTQAIVDSLPLGVVWKDTDHRVVGVNLNLIEGLAELGVDDAIGRRISEFDVDGGQGWSQWEELEQQALLEGRGQHAEFTINVGDETRTIRYSCSALLLGEEPIGFVGASQDITESKRLESELTETRRMESIGQLAAGIAHEINTPVQFVSDNTSFLADSFEDVLQLIERMEQLCRPENNIELDRLLTESDIEFLRDEVPGALTQSSEGLARVAEIVRAMKDFSHPGSDIGPGDLNAMITSTATVARNEWRYVAELHLDLADDLPPIRCNQGQIKQVVLNMIVNAAHAIAEAHGDDRPGTLTIATDVVDGSAMMRISDDGIGMSPEVKARIFDRFFTTKDVGLGTGQGLALAWEVVSAHDGSITVDSEPGRGTTFTIELPLHADVGVEVA